MTTTPAEASGAGTGPTTPAAAHGAGRYAPSPSGDLHLGNLRTALLAWLFARTSGRRFILRVDDLDRVRAGAEQRQLDDLRRLGLDWDGPVQHQSHGRDRYDSAIEQLVGAGMTYECFCTRKEIQQAATAPHGPMGAYPGTCRDLTPAERGERRAAGRPAALRLRAARTEFEITDRLHGRYRGPVDDLVLRRGDGIPAYNLAVVVDDAHQGVDQVVRGDDLLPSTPRQAYLATLLGLPIPEYAHVPLVLNTAGRRLAKRDGAVTLADRLAEGDTVPQFLGRLATSLHLAGNTPAELRAGFDPDRLPRKPWILDPGSLVCAAGSP